MQLNTNTSNQQIYHVLNKDVEVCNEYFDVVPDGNLYTMDDSPIFAIRMRAKGIAHIMNLYQKKYNFYTNVLTYQIRTNQYSIYTSDIIQMYNTQKDEILKYFDFSQCKNNSFRGTIIVASNKYERMVHAIPYIYGVINEKKKIIILDAFFSPDTGSGSIISADFFYQAYNGDIDCYCHGQPVQADHHSCGIIACDFIKNCLQNDAKVAKKIIDSVKMRIEIESRNLSKKTYINIFKLPSELCRFSQIKHNKAFELSLSEASQEQEKQERNTWFLNHIRTLIYRKNKDPYNPIDEILPTRSGEKKLINTSLLEKGHKYAGQIVKDLDQKTSYNSRYWLSLIRGQKEENMIRKIIRATRKMLKFTSNKN